MAWRQLKEFQKKYRIYHKHYDKKLIWCPQGGAYLGGKIASSFLNFKSALGANYPEYVRIFLRLLPLLLTTTPLGFIMVEHSFIRNHEYREKAGVFAIDMIVTRQWACSFAWLMLCAITNTNFFFAIRGKHLAFIIIFKSSARSYAPYLAFAPLPS